MSDRDEMEREIKTAFFIVEESLKMLGTLIGDLQERVYRLEDRVGKLHQAKGEQHGTSLN